MFSLSHLITCFTKTCCVEHDLYQQARRHNTLVSLSNGPELRFLKPHLPNLALKLKPMTTNEMSGMTNRRLHQARKIVSNKWLSVLSLLPVSEQRAENFFNHSQKSEVTQKHSYRDVDIQLFGLSTAWFLEGAAQGWACCGHSRDWACV